MKTVTQTELETFFEYLRFPSISAEPEHSGDVRNCAGWLRGLLGSWGLKSELRETAGAPVVFAQTLRLADRKTVLLYGHYDVQPVEPLDLWQSPPFEPEVRDEMICARGATDNKGQTFAHLIGLKRLLDEGDLPVNLLILLEGEEEVGSPNLAKYLEENRPELACDVALISDTSMISPGVPALTLGLRGIACMEVRVLGPRADLHSGMFGGAIPNPALALSRVLGRMQDADGRIAIPGFYAEVEEISEIEKNSWRLLPWGETWFEALTGITPHAGEKDRTVLERVWGRPTAEINGLTSGHQGAGSKTIIPSQASAKVSFRLVPHQDPDELSSVIIAWFEAEFAKEGVSCEVEYDHGGKPFYVPPDHPFIRRAAEALEGVFGNRTLYTREGLSIPVTALLSEKLNIPVVLAGIGLPDCQAHAPNETFPLAHLELGAQAHAAILRAWAI